MADKLLFYPVVLLLVVAANGVSGQPSQGPDVNFSKTKHAFDTLQQGPSYEHEFEFVNTGDQPLLINRVKTACRCLTPDWPKDPVKPKDTGIVKVTYFSDNRPGPFFKGIQVYTNIDESPLKILYVEGYVEKEEQ